MAIVWRGRASLDTIGAGSDRLGEAKLIGCETGGSKSKDIKRVIQKGKRSRRCCTLRCCCASLGLSGVAGDDVNENSRFGVSSIGVGIETRGWDRERLGKTKGIGKG